MEKRKNKMYLAKANLLNISFMPMASNVYGSMSVTFMSVLTKAAAMISEISGIPLIRWRNTGSKGYPLQSTNLIVKHFLTNESSSIEPITELKIIVRSANVEILISYTYICSMQSVCIVVV
jgi:hypothetical protein